MDRSTPGMTPPGLRSEGDGRAASASRLTPIQWVICAVACLGFAFDLYESLMLPLIVRPAVVALGHQRVGTPMYNLWVGLLFYVPNIAGGIFGLIGGYLTDLSGRRRILFWSILLYSISAAAASYSTSLPQLLILRCTTMIGICIEFVAAITWLAELFPNPAQRESVLAYTQGFHIRHLESIGVSPGFHCLEVGGGGGSIAAWLASRVAPTGHVLVTDIDTRFLDPMNLLHTQVIRHDIARDPLPKASFDLIHARLVLGHVPEREQALINMVSSLRPGGFLVVEEFDSSVFPDPTRGPGEVLTKTHIAMTQILDDHGVDRRLGRRLFGIFRRLGLVDVSAEGRTFMWPSGSPGTSLMHANYEQLRNPMIDAGYITAQEFNQDILNLDAPEFLMPSPILWTACGRRFSAS